MSVMASNGLQAILIAVSNFVIVTIGVNEIPSDVYF